MASNMLTGPIDNLLEGLPILNEFRVNNNNLTGTLPDHFGSKHLEVRLLSISPSPTNSAYLMFAAHSSRTCVDAAPEREVQPAFWMPARGSGLADRSDRSLDQQQQLQVSMELLSGLTSFGSRCNRATDMRKERAHVMRHCH